MYSDEGRRVTAALNPIVGAENIGRFFTGLTKKGVISAMRAELVTVNGQPGALLFPGEHLGGVVALDEINGVACIFLIVNPEKLPNHASAIGK